MSAWPNPTEEFLHSIQSSLLFLHDWQKSNGFTSGQTSLPMCELQNGDDITERALNYYKGSLYQIKPIGIILN